MDNLTSEQLEALPGLLEKAHGGPWRLGDGKCLVGPKGQFDFIPVLSPFLEGAFNDGDDHALASANMELAALAPQLAAEVLRLDAECERAWESQRIAHDQAMSNGEEVLRLRRENEGMREALEETTALLARYRNETPPGHSPHMICHLADAAIAKAQAALTGASLKDDGQDAPSGKPAPNAKLIEKQVRAIRAEYANSRLSCATIGRKYGHVRQR